MAQPRILLCGDVLGRLDQLYKRVASVNKSNGPFDALFCVGQFFPLDETNVEELKAYLDGQKQAPIPTYFTGNYGHDASKLLEAGRDLGLVSEPVPVGGNIFWLKGSGATVLHGLRVVFLSGKADMHAYEDAKLASEIGGFHKDDVDALRALADDKQVIDLLLTNAWPQAVFRECAADTVPAEADSIVGNPIVSELALELKPRYHVVGSEGLFFTRQPYANRGVSHVTRFVALGIVGNDKKQKYLHALSPSPASILSPEELSVIPPNSTACPYPEPIYGGDNSRKRILSETTSTSNSEGQYWRYDTTSQGKRQKLLEGGCYEFIAKGSCPRGETCKFKHTLDNGMPIPKKSCYFYLTRGACEKGPDCKFLHDFEETNGSGGEAASLPAGVCFNFVNKGSCAKGDRCRFSHAQPERNQPPCWFCLSSPTVETHLVVSVGDHCYCALAKGPLMEKHMLIIPIEHIPCAVAVSREVEHEVQMYKDALRRCFEAEGQSVLVFERYIHLRAGTHAHVQVIPVSASAAEASRQAFESAAKDLGFSFIVIPQGGNHFNELRRLLDGVNYFVVEFPDGTILVHPCAAGEKMPMQFGREIVAGLLGTPEKSDWRSCKLSKEEETELVEKFKEQFKTFDPMQSS